MNQRYRRPLGQRKKMIFALHVLFGWPLRQIARITGTKVGVVAKHLQEMRIPYKRASGPRDSHTPEAPAYRR